MSLRPVTNAPVVVLADPTNVAHGANPLASSLFSVSDVDGDTMAKYQFWNSTADAASGELDGERRCPGDRRGDRCHGRAAWPDHVPVRLGNRRPVGTGERRHQLERLEGVPCRCAGQQCTSGGVADPTNVAHGANPLASSLFSVSDVDGDTMAKSQVLELDGRCGERRAGW